ncbi:MAG: LPS export ABC transporter periplasmic protein LptC, partial [Nitrospinota bacterium]
GGISGLLLKQWGGFLLVACTLVGGAMLVQHGWERPVVSTYRPIESRNVDPVVRLENFHLVDTVQQRKQWELSAAVAQNVQGDPDRVVLQNLEMTFFPATSPPITLVARRGELSKRTRTVRVEGDVHLDNGQGYLLTTESLRWDPVDRVLYTHDWVRIRGQGLEVEGRGFRSDVTRQEMKVREAVRVRIVPAS